MRSSINMHLLIMTCFLALTAVSVSARTCHAGANQATCQAQEAEEAAASGGQALLQVGSRSTRSDAASTLLKDTLPEAPAGFLLVSETEEYEDEEEALKACGAGGDCPKGLVSEEERQSKVDAAIAVVETLNPDSKEAREADDVAKAERVGEKVNLTEVEDIVNKASSEETVETARHNGNEMNTEDIAELTGANGEYREGADEGDEMEPDETDRLLLEQLKRGFGWKPWADGQVKYCYAADVSDKMKSLIEVAIDAIKRAVPCIQFENLGISSVKSTETKSSKKTCGNDPGPAIFFQTANEGCWSYVGEITAWKAQMLNLADPGCGVLGTAIHEILHSLGQGHEHVRLDRNQYVTIQWENIKDEYRPFFMKKSKSYDQDSYDFSSIMHYGTGSFSKNGKQVIVPKGGDSIGQRTQISQGDADQLAEMYKKVNSTCAATNQNKKVGCKDIQNYKCPTNVCKTEEDLDKCCSCGGGIEYKCWDGSTCEYPKKLKFASDSVCVVDGSSIWKGQYGCVVRNICPKKLTIKCTGHKGKRRLKPNKGWSIFPWEKLCSDIGACTVNR